MAYQGKFSQQRNPEETVVLNAETPVETPVEETPVVEIPVVEVPEAQEAPMPAAPVKKQAPKKNTSAKKGGKKKKKKKKKANRTVTIVFYTCYFVMVAALLAGIFFLRSWLVDYLTSYEASQPTTRCEEIFQEHFADPDWSDLYTKAGLTGTEYEGGEAFAAYMNAKVGSAELSYVETSAGLSGGHKYLLKLGSETIGYFTLVDQASANAEVANWQLGQVVLNHSYNESVTVQTMGDMTVYVNGVALTDDHTIQIGTTKVEEYLPEGVHGPRIYTKYLSGLMMEPVVTAADAQGNPVEITYDSEKDLYVAQTAENTISVEEYDRVLMTAKTYALRMIEKASATELGKYFDSSSKIYKTIVSIDPWMQQRFFSSYRWSEESITGYYRHNEKLFSVHVTLTMFVTRTDDTVKEYNVDHSFLFEKQGNSWKCVNMTNVDFQEQSAIVRLTFMLGDTVVFTNLYEEDVTSLTLPTLTAPSGKVFAGWFQLNTNADGSMEYSQVFAPEAGNKVELPSGTTLSPMTLYALFENAPSDGGNE